MKQSRHVLSVVLLIFLTTVAIALFTACKKENEAITVNLNEVVHSIFYAPQYVAIEKGFFEEEGIKINLTAGQGADKSMTALISGDADIALLGTEAGIYVYNEGKENYSVSFAQLTQRAGNFLVSRENETDFSWENIKDKTIIGGRAGGMPQMILEYVLAQNGIDINKDVEILTNLQFTTTAGAFVGGVGNYTAEFDPSAYNIEKEGKGYVVASLGLESGKVPYTVYMATQQYIKDHPETIQKFTNAIYKAQLWVESHSSKEIAEVIAPHFKENEIADIEFIVERYKAQESWKNNPLFEEQSLKLIEDIMEFGGELSSRVPYADLVNTKFAQNSIKNIK